eukprot:6206079-Pleurochrysis_carterae.AAC.2
MDLRPRAEGGAHVLHLVLPCSKPATKPSDPRCREGSVARSEQPAAKRSAARKGRRRVRVDHDKLRTRAANAQRHE